MHQNPSATTAFESDVHVLAVEGEPDTLAFYTEHSRSSWLTMDDPLDLREYR